MGMFDQNKGRLPMAGQSMGPAAGMPAQVVAGPQMGVAQGMPASQITAPRLVDQNLVPPGAATPMPAPQGQPMPPQMGQRPYAPLNFGGMGRPQLPPGVGGMPMQRPDMQQRPMPPQAMNGMAPGNFDPAQIRNGLQGLQQRFAGNGMGQMQGGQNFDPRMLAQALMARRGG